MYLRFSGGGINLFRCLPFEISGKAEVDAPPKATLSLARVVFVFKEKKEAF